MNSKFMNPKLTSGKILLGLAVLLGTTLGGQAQDQAQTPEAQPGVARISLIHGDASTQRGDSGEWTTGTVNTPVSPGDSISSGTRSRVELQLDFANILRMDERAQVKIADLTRTHIQLQINEGLINYTVLKGSDADVEIDTSNVAVRPMRGEGSFRILVIDDQTHVIVRRGEADVTTPQGSTRVKNGQEISVRGRDNPEFQISEAPRHDDWDNWNKDRDHKVRDAESWRHTNRYYAGTEELDHSGRWNNVAGYGEVWQPNVSSDWAPYRDGRWVWEPYYGWTWVSYESWGWAPYHYGRWFYYGSAWNWWPGPTYADYYPVYAPAYVSFIGFGFGNHFGLGFGFGSIGWLPIGPSDCFFPWWGGNRREFNNVNVTNITNVNNITNITNVNNVQGGIRPFAPLAGGTRPLISNLNGVLKNPRLQDAVTAMPSDQFGKAGVAHNRVPVTSEALRQGRVVTGNVPVVPTRESLRAVDRPVNSTTMPRNTGQPQHFFAKSQPTFTPQPFHEQAAQVQQAMQQHQASLQSGKAATPVTPGLANKNPVSSTPAIRPTGNQPAANVTVGSKPATPSPAPGSSTDRQGWHRFGPVTPAPGQPQTRPETQGPVQSRPVTPAPAQTRPQTTAPAPSSAQPPHSSPGWQKFSGPPRPATPEHSVPQQRESVRPPAAAQAPPSGQGSTWQRFTPQSGSQASPRGGERPASSGRAPNMQIEQPRNLQPSQRPDPSSNSSSSPRNYTPTQNYPRPALDLHRQIVSPRSSPNYGGSYGGGSQGSGRSYSPSGGSRGGPSGSYGGGSQGSGRGSSPSGGSPGGPSGSYGGGGASHPAPSGGSRGSSSGSSGGGGSSHPPHGSGAHGRG